MKKKNNWFKKFLTISFIIFMGLYISSESGFYEAKLSNKVALTDKAIKEFENDVIEGKTVDVNTYISNKNVDYSNKFTSSGERLSEAVTKILTEGFTNLNPVCLLLNNIFVKQMEQYFHHQSFL